MIRLLAALLLLPALAQAAPDARFDKGSSSKISFSAKKFQSMGLNDVPAMPTFGPHERLWIVADAPAKELAALGVAIEEISPNRVAGTGTGRMARVLAEKGVKFTATPVSQIFRAQDFPAEDAAFRNYDRANAELRALAAAAPELASVFSIGQSLQGRDILALRLNTSAKGEAPSKKPGALFLGTHHSREHLSTEVPLLIARWLVENRAKPDVEKLLADRDVYFIPMVNPDGVEIDVRDGKYHMHRRNARPTAASGDIDASGVDLNRNYASHWGEAGSSTDPESDTYQGPAAFSEPETQAVKAFIDARPNLKTEVSYHSYSELILWPWSWTSTPLEDARAVSAFKNMATEMARMTGYTPEQSSALYPSSGDTCDWSWEAHHIFSFTFELTPKSMWEGGFYPGAVAIQTTFQANLRPALYLIGMSDDPYRAADAAVGASR